MRWSGSFRTNLIHERNLGGFEFFRKKKKKNTEYRCKGTIMTMCISQYAWKNGELGGSGYVVPFCAIRKENVCFDLCFSFTN